MRSNYCGQPQEHALGLHQRVPQTGFSAFQKMNENDSISGSVAKAMKELPDETLAPV